MRRLEAYVRRDRRHPPERRRGIRDDARKGRPPDQVGGGVGATAAPRLSNKTAPVHVERVSKEGLDHIRRQAVSQRAPCQLPRTARKISGLAASIEAFAPATPDERVRLTVQWREYVREGQAGVKRQAIAFEDIYRDAVQRNLGLSDI